MSDEIKSVLVKEPGGRERRRDPRKKSLLAAAATTDGGSFDCYVRDLSSSGARVESARKVSLDQPIVLSAEAIGTKSGRVVWLGEGSFAVRFDTLQGEGAANQKALSAGTSVHRPADMQRGSIALVEFKRFEGATVLVNPIQVLYVVAQSDGKHCEIHFGNDAHVVVQGDSKRVRSQLTE